MVSDGSQEERGNRYLGWQRCQMSAISYWARYVQQYHDIRQPSELVYRRLTLATSTAFVNGQFVVVKPVKDTT